jgi:hypothetical protein
MVQQGSVADLQSAHEVLASTIKVLKSEQAARAKAMAALGNLLSQQVNWVKI